MARTPLLASHLQPPVPWSQVVPLLAEGWGPGAAMVPPRRKLARGIHLQPEVQRLLPHAGGRGSPGWIGEQQLIFPPGGSVGTTGPRRTSPWALATAGTGLCHIEFPGTPGGTLHL